MASPAKGSDLCSRATRRRQSHNSTPHKTRQPGSPDRSCDNNFEFYCTALSPELTRGLNRRKKHFQSSMSHIEDRIARKDSKGTERPTYTQIGQEINNIETDIEDVIQLYGLRACARLGHADSD